VIHIGYTGLGVLGCWRNRFSKDTYTVDEALMPSMYMYLQCAVQVLGTVLVIRSAGTAQPGNALCLVFVTF
jgi:hypothetical protein